MLITTKEAAERASICKTTLWRLSRRYADFPRPIVLGRIKRFKAAELDAWFDARRAGGEDGDANR